MKRKADDNIAQVQREACARIKSINQSKLHTRQKTNKEAKSEILPV
jgi:hypothetical protein